MVPRCGCSDSEAEGAQLLAAVLGDLLRAPRRHPDPVDRDVLDQAAGAAAGEGGAGLLLDHVRQRAGRRRQGHVDDRLVVLDLQAVDQAQVDDVDPELGVDHVPHGLLDVVERGALAGGRRGRRLRHAGRPPDDLRVGRPDAVVAHASSFTRATASLNAIQPSRAHFTRAGYLETPANAMPSPMTSSSPAILPRLCAISWKDSRIRNASSTLLPTTRSVSTDVDAWLIEQPRDS